MKSLTTSGAAVFAERRRRLSERLQELQVDTQVVLSSGWARPRNFAHSHFPFRAESHFLFLVGHHIEGALLVGSVHGKWTLYLEPSDEEVALWSGPERTLVEWSVLLALDVRPLSELPRVDYVALPPQDEATAAWLSSLLDLDVEAQSAPDLVGDAGCLAQAMVELRLHKDEAALVQLREVTELSAHAHVLGMRVARTARSEAEVRAAIEAHFTAHGLANAYTSIVTTRGEILHSAHSDQLLAPGSLLLCDAGAESKEGFAADITRTWPTNGRFSSTQRELYEAVLNVQKRAIAGAVPGVHFVELHQQAMRDMGDVLLDLGILKGSVDTCLAVGAVSVFFPHGLGHLLGLDVHDMEDLGDRAGYDEQSQRSPSPILRYLRLARVLQPNMVVTIEPGFYQVPLLLRRAQQDLHVKACIDWQRLSSFQDVRGIRIEDDVLIQGETPCVLSALAPKEVAELEATISPG